MAAYNARCIPGKVENFVLVKNKQQHNLIENRLDCENEAFKKIATDSHAGCAKKRRRR